MRALGVERVYVLEDQDPFDLPLAAIVAEDAKRAGIEVVGEDTIDTTASTEFADEAKKIAESGAQAVFFSGLPGAGAVALWQQLHAADPQSAAARVELALRRLAPELRRRRAVAADAGAAATRRRSRCVREDPLRGSDRRGGRRHLPGDAGASDGALPARRADRPASVPQRASTKSRTRTRCTGTRR